MKGIIACVKHSEAKGEVYFMASAQHGFRCTEIRDNPLLLSAGDVLSDDWRTLIEGKDAEKCRDEVYSALGAKISERSRKEVYKKGIKELDTVTAALWAKLESASKLFMRKLMLGIPIIVRFHNDADGSGGAYSLYIGIKDLAKRSEFASNMIWIMNKGVSYSRSDAENDILTANNFTSVEKPLLVIIDFGTSVDSNPGIEAIRGRFDIIWLDHHPLQKGFGGFELENYVNPWSFGGDSNYTAGFLASAFAKTFSNVDAGEFENASFIGDYSEYADPEGNGADASTIFDLVTSDLGIAFGPGKSNVTPQEFEGIFSNREKKSELLAYANVRLNEVLDSGIKSLKRYKARDFEIFLLDFEDIRSEESKYPLPGRFASKLLSRINTSGAVRVMVIVHVGAYLLMRLDKGLCSDMSLLDIIEDVKAKYGDAVEGGGGHRCAGAIKLRDKSNKKSVINDIIKSLK